VGQPFQIGGKSHFLAAPAIVFNALDDVFLVAWDKGDANHTLLGQYVTRDGILIDTDGQPNAENFAIADMVVSNNKRLGVGFNQAMAHFVLSWSDDYKADDYDVHAQYVSSVVDHDWPAFASSRGQMQPAIACNDAGTQCLTVVTDEDGAVPTLQAGFVSGSETFTGTQVLDLALTPGVTYTQPSLIFMPVSGLWRDYYVLAATTYISGNADIRTWWIDDAGNVITSTVVVSETGN
jgi:hypothetical protein